MVLTILRRNPEVFIPGPPLLTWSNVDPFGSSNLIMITIIVIYSILLITSIVAKRNSTSYAIILGIFLLLICCTNTWATFLQDLRHAPLDFSIFGRIEHAVPDVGHHILLLLLLIILMLMQLRLLNFTRSLMRLTTLYANSSSINLRREHEAGVRNAKNMQHSNWRSVFLLPLELQGTLLHQKSGLNLVTGPKET